MRCDARPSPSQVYGDGRASQRIVTALRRWRDGQEPLLPDHLEFVADTQVVETDLSLPMSVRRT